MARLRLPTCVVLLLLAAAGLAQLASSSSAAPAPPPPEGKVRVMVRYADEEEAQWLDSWAETHQPLGSGGGHFKLTPASPEVSAWLNRLFGRGGAAKGAAGEARDGEGGATAGGGGSDHRYRHYVVLKHNADPRGRVIEAFLARLAKMREDQERAKAEQQKDTKDL